MSRRKQIKSVPLSGLSPLPKEWLNLLDIEVQGKLSETNRLIVVQPLTVYAEMPKCPLCGLGDAVILADIRVSNVNDVQRDGKNVLIVLRRQRCMCSRCEHTFTPVLPWLESGKKRQTRRLTKVSEDLIKKRYTTSAVADQADVCRRTVQTIANRLEAREPSAEEVFRLAAAEDEALVLQVDDCHPARQTNTAFMLNGHPFELLEFYGKLVIASFFARLEGREKVKVYVSDLARFLLYLGRKFFPNALLVADPFHVIRRLWKALARELKPVKRKMLAAYISAIEDGRLIRPCFDRHKKRKKEVRKSKEEPKAKKPTAREVERLLRTRIDRLNRSQKKAVKFLLKNFPEVRPGYFYLQRVLALYRAELTAAEASKALDRFESRLPMRARSSFREFLKLCKRHRDAICAYWTVRWTNGKPESQNGVISSINRQGGALDFKERRRRWLHSRSISSSLREKQGSRTKVEQKLAERLRKLKELPAPEPVPIARPGETGSLF